MDAAFARGVLESDTVSQGLVLKQQVLVSSREDVGGMESCPCWIPWTLSDLRDHAHPVTFSDLLSKLIRSARAGI